MFVAKPGSTYRVAPLFLVPIGLAILVHNLGAMGWYQKSPLPWSFDIYVHFYFGVVGGLLVYRMLHQSLPLRGWTLGFMTALLMIGAGAVHERSSGSARCCSAPSGACSRRRNRASTSSTLSATCST